MTDINLERAAEEMWEIWGLDGHRICLESAERHDELGEMDMAKGRREIGDAVLKHIEPSMGEGHELAGALSRSPARMSVPPSRHSDDSVMKALQKWAHDFQEGQN